MKDMAHPILVRLPSGRVVTSKDVATRLTAWGETLGWALLTFAVLYFSAALIASWL